MPLMSDTMTEGVIVDWLVQVGEEVKIGDLLAEIETDKATMELESEFEGVLLHQGAQKGEAVPVKGILAIIGEKGESVDELIANFKPEGEESTASEEKPAPEPVAASAPAQPAVTESKPLEASETTGDRLKASPLARKMAEDQGIDLALVDGSGDGGRIIKRDIESYTPASTAGAGVAAVAGVEGYEDVTLSQMRKAIARRLSESKFSAPHFYLTAAINMDRVVAARKSINDYLGYKVSYNDIIIKAVAAALRSNPSVNASWMGDKIRKHSHIHIGVATAIDDGLIVPVVKHADIKGISAISAEVKELAQKAREKKLQPEEFSGNTFTISNLGMFGIEEFTAIINPPDACILAVGGISQAPVVRDGQVVVGNVMKVTLSCDHRVVDGAVGSRFLQTLSQYLEEPLRILA